MLDKMLDNVFLHEKYYSTFFDRDLRLKRLEDINNLSIFYKTHNLLSIDKDYNINNILLKKWINSHKTEEDKQVAEALISPITYISFPVFMENLLESINRFNRHLLQNKIKKYYLIIGANTASGTRNQFFINISKSNFWIILIIYPYLLYKPHDILLSLNQAIEFSVFDKIEGKKMIDNFLFVDDASYSGSQLFEETIGTQLLQKHYLDALFEKTKINSISKNNLKIKTSLIKKSNNYSKHINIHIAIPFISLTAKDKALSIEIRKNIKIHLYNTYYIKNYEDYYEYDSMLGKLTDTYNNQGFYKNLIPLYFAHKMPDGVSTIDYILLSGIVINYSDIKKQNKLNKLNELNKLNKNKNNKIFEKKPEKIEKKYVQFINNCTYPKNKVMNPQKLSYWGCNKLCPISPSKIAKEYVDKYLIRILL